MRQLDGMQSTSPTAATVSNMNGSRPALPAAFAAGQGGASFGATFRQVQGEVADFLAHGSGGHDAPSAQALSAAGMALREQTRQGAIAGATAAGEHADAGIEQQFLASIQPWAEETAGRLGVAPQVVAAHAALESGWGQHPLRAGGADSNNLFGLKAGATWRGAVAAATTTEFEHGAALKKVERFRSYPDTASAFRDYADMLTSNPRFHGALHTGADARAFAQGLAQGGYATDPAYADKLSKLAARLQRRDGIIGSATPLPQSGD